MSRTRVRWHEIAEQQEPATLEGGEKILAHPKSQCANRGFACVIHSPSHHSMRHLRQHWRDDTKMMERICEHGVGHPDPDHLAYIRRTRGQLAADTDGVHGCDGCCSQ